MLNKVLSVFLCFLLPLTAIKKVYAEIPAPKTLAEKLESVVNLLEVPEDELGIGEAISPLYKGNKAPFSGVHLSPMAVAFIYVELKSVAKTIEIEVERAKKEAEAYHKYEINKKKIEYDADVKVLNVKIEANEKNISFLEKRLIEEEKKRESVPLWTGLGFLAGVGISLLTVYVVSETVN